MVWIMACAIWSTAMPASATSSVPASPSLAQVQSAVQSALSTTTMPKVLTPALAAFNGSANVSKLIGDFQGADCNPNLHPSQVLSPVPCLFGNLQSSKTIVLYGDSNAGNWIPAFKKGLAASPYRLAVFFYPACPTADLNYTGSLLSTPAIASSCNQWHQAAETAIAAMKPIAIVAVQSLAMSWKISTANWIPGMVTFFKNATVGSPATKRIIFGTSPSFHLSVPSCLARAHRPADCALTTPMYATTLAGRDPQVASAIHGVLIQTSGWFCKKALCAPELNGNVVVGDLDHTTIAASNFLSTVATSSLEAALR